MKTAFLFPGQGTQFIGMGKEIYNHYEDARKIYDKASQISGIDLVSLCFEGPEEKLNQTQYTQLAVLVTSLAFLEVLTAHEIQADLAVGLSLGEYTALIYGGYLSFEDGICLVKKRGDYMGNFLPKEEFQMAAVIGLDSKIIEEECKKQKEKGNFVVPANYNYSGQTVLSGTVDAICEITEKLKEKGARKVVALKTSGPFHTEKLIVAKQKYEQELNKVCFQPEKATKKVIKNIDGTYYKKTDDMREILANHIISPVRFDKAMKQMEQEKIEQYIEIGPGKTLTGFIRKEDREANTININDLESLQAFLEK